MEKKTLFITSFHPLISRNILMSGVLELLSKTNNIIILAPIQKEEYFREVFEESGVRVIGVSAHIGKRDLLFRKLILAVTNTKDLTIKKRAEFQKDKKIFSYIASILPAKIVRGKKWCVNIIRFLDEKTADTSRFKDIFEEYKPDVVVSTDIQNEIDIAFLREARAQGISAIGSVRSWDNLTSKGILRFIPDHLLVPNEIVKDEAIRISFVKPELITVTGIPHYDRYKQVSSISTSEKESVRNAFLEKNGFDHSKKIILFAPFGDRYIKNNGTDRLILETLCGLGCNVLVRMPPTDTVNLEKFNTKNAKISFYESGKSAWRGGKKLNEVSEKDEHELIDSLIAADVVVTGQSTIAIDAAAFDKPIVIANFDAEPRSYFNSVKRYFDYEYYRKFRERSGLRMAHSASELVTLVEQSLVDSNIDKGVREQIRKEQLFGFRGDAAKKFAEAILGYGHK